ncbi:hypothetical protein [Cupriavidus plantarum]|uniref:hypothetical protein n=1 Tax=Cupriavidus plantarum TaxID=942865 RepID=UPI000EAC64A7|nr:hypothetical protein [Cupriavidus plantarum]RLK35506.1 hypothetical protein C7417_3276 [Cupriavidus plantarum]
MVAKMTRHASLSRRADDPDALPAGTAPAVPLTDIRPSLGIRAALWVSAFASLATLAWVLWFCRFGLDFADEGFYLVWISAPYRYAISATQFGFVYHPLHLLLQGNIAALRQANVLLTFGLAWWAASSCLNEIFGHASMARWMRLIVAAALATVALMFLRLWLPTPSYNWLAFQGMLLALSGMLLAQRTASARSIAGWALIGLAGTLVFLAKPTSAAVLGVCVLAYVGLAGKLNWRMLAIAVLTAALCCAIAAFAIDGSLTGFLTRLRRGSAQAFELGAGYSFTTLLRIDVFQLDAMSRQAIAWGVMFIGGAAYLLSSRLAIVRGLGLVLILAALVYEAIVVLGIPEKPTEFGEFQHLMLLAVPMASVLLALVLPGSTLRGLSRRHWALALVLAVLPHAFAFGTNNNYWWLGGLVALFWVLAALVLLSPAASYRGVVGLLLPLAMGAQLIVVTQVHSGMQGPYYQPQPLQKDDYRVDFGARGGVLWLAPTHGKYATDAIGAARTAGFVAGTPMIDLSGHSPGLLYAIGAENTGQAWIIGKYPGYAGAEVVAASILDRVDCAELARAWLLVEPGGPVSLPTRLLSRFGAHADSDYELAGSFETAPIVGGFTPVKTQQFMRPRRSPEEARAACEAVRR